MANGREMWVAAEALVQKGSVRSANAMRFYALNRMLAEAEHAMLTGSDADASDRVRELQAHCEQTIAILTPGLTKGPRLVVAA